MEASESPQAGLFDFSSKVWRSMLEFRALNTDGQGVFSEAALKALDAMAAAGFTAPERYRRVSNSEAELLCVLGESLGDAESFKAALASKLESSAEELSKRMFYAEEGGRAVLLHGRIALGLEDGKLKVEQVGTARADFDAKELVTTKSADALIRSSAFGKNSGRGDPTGGDLLRDMGALRRTVLGLQAGAKKVTEAKRFGDSRHKMLCAAFYGHASPFSNSHSIKTLNRYNDGSPMDQRFATARSVLATHGRLLLEHNKVLADKAASLATERFKAYMDRHGLFEGSDYLDAMDRSRTLTNLAETKGTEDLAAFRGVVEETPAIGLFAAKLSRYLGLPINRDLVGGLKGRLKARGLSDGGWKKLCKVLEEAPGTVDELISGARRAAPVAGEPDKGSQAEMALSRMCAAFSLAASSNVEPKVAAEFCAAANGYGTAGRAVFALLGEGLPSRTVATPEAAIAYAGEWKAKEDRKTSVASSILRRAQEIGAAAAVNEWGDIWDWLERSGDCPWQSLPEKPDMKGMRRRSEQWHQILAEREAGDRAAIKWEPTMEHPTFDKELGLKATELTDGKALWLEGQRMHHCVASYVDSCLSGACRIVSIEDLEGGKIATMELRPNRASPDAPTTANAPFGILDEKKPFMVVQLKGPCNAVPSEAARVFAEKVAERFGEAWTLVQGRRALAAQQESLDLEAEPEALTAPKAGV